MVSYAVMQFTTKLVAGHFAAIATGLDRKRLAHRSSTAASTTLSITIITSGGDPVRQQPPFQTYHILF